MWINYLVQNFSEVENVAAKEKKLHEPIYITKQLDRIWIIFWKFSRVHRARKDPFEDEVIPADPNAPRDRSNNLHIKKNTEHLL